MASWFPFPCAVPMAAGSTAPEIVCVLLSALVLALIGLGFGPLGRWIGFETGRSWPGPEMANVNELRGIWQLYRRLHRLSVPAVLDGTDGQTVAGGSHGGTADRWRKRIGGGSPGSARHGRRGVQHGFGLLAGSLLLLACSQPHQLSGMVWNQPRAIPFTLSDQHGRSVGLHTLQGKVTLLYFGYTNCPDACPTTLADFVQVKRSVGRAADQTNFMLISVDPQRDTQEVLARYLSTFDPSFIGLRGDAVAVQRVTKEYGIIADVPHTAQHTSPAVGVHDTSIWLLDTQGRIRTIYPLGTSVDAIVADIQALLAEEPN